MSTTLSTVVPIDDTQHIRCHPAIRTNSELAIVLEAARDRLAEERMARAMAITQPIALVDNDVYTDDELDALCGGYTGNENDRGMLRWNEQTGRYEA